MPGQKPWEKYAAPAEGSPWLRYAANTRSDISPKGFPAATDMTGVPTSVGPSSSFVPTTPTGEPISGLSMLQTGWGRLGTPQPAPKTSGEALANLKEAMKGYGKNLAEMYGGALAADIGGEIPEYLGKIPAVAKIASDIREGAEATPFVGRYMRAIEGAPTMLGAAARGAAGGALAGGVEGAFRGDPGKAALYGAGTGAALGAGLHVLGRIAGPDYERMGAWMNRGYKSSEQVEAAAARRAARMPVGVKVIPEPRATLPTDRPGSQWSIKRPELLPAAMRGQPGAGDVLSNIGAPILYEPSGAGIRGVRESVPMGKIEIPDVSEGFLKGEPMEAPTTHSGTVAPDDFINKVSRGRIHQPTVDAYRADIRAGKPLEPVEIEYDENGNVTGANGRHRALAAKQEGVERIPVRVVRTQGK